MMNSVLSGLNGTRCFVYLDDIVIYARSLADHNTKLREVLDRWRRWGCISCVPRSRKVYLLRPMVSEVRLAVASRGQEKCISCVPWYLKYMYQLRPAFKKSVSVASHGV
jgi:hypothetical protein